MKNKNYGNIAIYNTILIVTAIFLIRQQVAYLPVFIGLIGVVFVFNTLSAILLTRVQTTKKSRTRRYKKLNSKNTFGSTDLDKIYLPKKNYFGWRFVIVNFLADFLNTALFIRKYAINFVFALRVNKPLSALMIGFLLFGSFSNFSFYSP